MLTQKKRIFKYYRFLNHEVSLEASCLLRLEVKVDRLPYRLKTGYINSFSRSIK